MHLYITYGGKIGTYQQLRISSKQNDHGLDHVIRLIYFHNSIHDLPRIDQDGVIPT